MILAENFIDWLINTERDLGYRVNERYQKYLLTLPGSQAHDGDISIDGRYLMNWRNGNYLIWRTTEREQSVLIVCERTSTVMAEIIADSIRHTHSNASAEDTTQEIQRLTAVCLAALNGNAE